MRNALVAVLGLAVVTACAASGSPPSPGPTAPLATPEVQHECEDVELRSPGGDIVFLSGRWIGSGDPNALPRPSVYQIRQTNNCIVWVGLSAEEGEALGESWLESFSGYVRPDFTVVGHWDELPDGGRGSVTVGIEFVTADGQEEVELHMLSSTGNIHRTKSWVRQDTPN